MPRSKRNKLVSLTKTKPKQSDHKQILVQKIHDALKKYDKVMVIEHKNLTTAAFRGYQQEWKVHSKFFLGKNKVMQVGLGTTEETSTRKNSYLLSSYLKGDRGLVFTNHQNLQEEYEYFLFDKIDIAEFARAGEKAGQTIVLEKGVDALKQFSFSMEPYLRKLGLNTQLINQQIVLNENYILAKEGKELTVEQCKLLKLLGIKLSKFELNVVCELNKKGSFKKV